MSEGRLHVQFRAGELSPALAARRDGARSPGDVARRDLERYYAVLAAELATIDLMNAEQQLILDALNGVLHDTPASARTMLWAGVADAITLDGLAEKWGVDGNALIAKLRRLSLAAALAVIDAAERYWAAVGRGEAPSPPSINRSANPP